MLKKSIATLIILAILIEFALLSTLPDSICISLAISKRNDADLLNLIVPRFLAKTKLTTLGFKNCTLEDSIVNNFPIVNFIVNGYGDPPENINDVEDLIRKAISSGCSVNANEPEAGTTPLHTAVLFNNPRLAAFLINSGADKKAKLKRPSKQADGLTPLEFANLLIHKNKNIDRSEILKIIK